MLRLSAIRTRPLPDVTSAFKVWAKATMATTILSVSIGLLLLGLSWLIGKLWFYYPLISKLEAASLVFTLSPVVALPVLILSLPLIIATLVKGYAGWAVAMACGICAAMLAFLVLEDFQWHSDMGVIGAVLGSVFGALFWGCTRLYDPRPDTEAPT